MVGHIGLSKEERGRADFVVPTGRGGAGNAVRSPSRGRPAADPLEIKKQEEYIHSQAPLHAGRGGAGNVRSPSRDPADRKKMEEYDQKEHQVQVDAIRKEEHQPIHSGRGGVGNIRSDSHERARNDGRGRESGIGSAIRSLSRSRSREPRASSGQRTESHYEDKLGAVDESSSTINGSGGGHEGHAHHGLLDKIAHKLPHAHHNS